MLGPARVADLGCEAGRAPHAERPGGGGAAGWENDPSDPTRPRLHRSRLHLPGVASAALSLPFTGPSPALDGELCSLSPWHLAQSLMWD
ncbi:hypothetical protein R6Z07F_009887 [Ovis aries]